MKNLKIVLLAAFVSLALAACAWADVTFEQPALVTTAGQSIEAATVDFHFQKAKVKSILENLARPDKLEGVKTLVIVPGHSLKGLGSAGIDETAELERVKKLDEEDRRICELIALGMDERKAAAAMGLSKSTFHDRKERLMARLRKEWADLI